MKVRLTRVSIDLIKVADEIQNPATERRTMDTNRKRPRPLSDGEIAGMILEDTFNPNETRYRQDYLGEFPYDEDEQTVERRRDQEEKQERFIAWWKSVTYEQRLAMVKGWYDTLSPHIREGEAPAEDVANIADISSNWRLLRMLTGIVLSQKKLEP
ncbi:MAG: hypothetical protein DMG96_16785 [Acidobacteria bacterium]|nr:MAG: hypothetical protein DMG96_16785 [Acidobacteriota bacterium]